MSYNISGKALKELQILTKDAPSGTFTRKKQATSGSTSKNIV